MAEKTPFLSELNLGIRSENGNLNSSEVAAASEAQQAKSQPGLQTTEAHCFRR